MISKLINALNTEKAQSAAQKTMDQFFAAKRKSILSSKPTTPRKKKGRAA